MVPGHFTSVTFSMSSPLILTFRDSVAGSLLIEIQTEFVFLVLRVKLEASSQADTCYKF